MTTHYTPTNEGGKLLYTVELDPSHLSAVITAQDSNPLLPHLSSRRELGMLTREIHRVLGHDLKARLGHELVEQHAVAAQWVIPRTRSHMFKSGPCVYFVTTPKRSSLIKIGSTDNLTSRLNSMFHQVDHSPLAVLAFCKTEAYRELEYGFHKHFDQYLELGREWFSWQPVVEYLQQFLAFQWRPENENTDADRPQNGTTQFQRKYYPAHLVSTSM